MRYSNWVWAMVIFVTTFTPCFLRIIILNMDERQDSKLFRNRSYEQGQIQEPKMCLGCGRTGDFLSRFLNKLNKVFNTSIKSVVTHLKQNIASSCNWEEENVLYPIVSAKWHANLRKSLNILSYGGHGNKWKT